MRGLFLYRAQEFIRSGVLEDARQTAKLVHKRVASWGHSIGLCRRGQSVSGHVRKGRVVSTVGETVTPSATRKPGAPIVVAFVCENAGRAGWVPSSGIRHRPSTPDFAWPLAVKEVVVPCAGRLQPEHFLKAFEDGADAIGVICCEESNCHHQEGSRRCARRMDHVGGMLEQIGLGSGRLRLFHLRGSAQEDMALGLDPGTVLPPDPAMGGKVAAIRDAFVAHLATVSPNPVRTIRDLPEESPYEVDDSDESDE